MKKTQLLFSTAFGLVVHTQINMYKTKTFFNISKFNLVILFTLLGELGESGEMVHENVTLQIMFSKLHNILASIRPHSVKTTQHLKSFSKFKLSAKFSTI